jgi:hypothetical protein
VFADKNVGTGKTVTLTTTYGGADRNNYSITHQATSTANITPKALTISGITASDKTYDNTTGATLSVAAGQSVSSLVGNALISGDDVTFNTISGVFSDENVGTGKTVTLTSSYTGAQRNNYTITSQATTTANITPLDVALSGSTGLTKVYDATTAVAPALTSPATGYGSLSVAAGFTSALTADNGINGGLVITGTPVFSNANAGTVTDRHTRRQLPFGVDSTQRHHHQSTIDHHGQRRCEVLLRARQHHQLSRCALQRLCGRANISRVGRHVESDA